MTGGPPLPRCHPAWWIATVFGIGRLPVAPGTWASLATVLVFVAINQYLSILYMVIFALTIIFLGIWASGRYVEALDRDDPAEVVIDEVAGQLLALAVAPATWWGFLAAFLLFRVFDILKPFPVGWLDRNLKGGLGVMADDLAAGIYAAIIIVLGVYIAKSV